MAISTQLITVLARINPHLWEIPHPHAPFVAQAASRPSRLDPVALNPQPLPPKERFLVASAEAAHGMAQAVIAAEAAGNSVDAILSRSIDDWCGTPRPWPWPWPWPGPWPPLGPDPEPHPEWDYGASRLVGCLTIASVAARMNEGEARAALERAADQLYEAALAQ